MSDVTTADVRRKITPPDFLTISGENLKVVLGLTSGDSFFRSPQEQKRRPERLELPPLGSHGLLYARWLVNSPGPYKVELKSIKGGRAEMVAK